MSEHDRMIFTSGLVALALVHSLLSIFELYTQVPPLWGYGHFPDGSPVLLGNPFLGGHVPRTQSTMGHPIAAACVVAVGFLVLLLRRASLRPWVFATQLAFLSIGILLTGTRSSVLGICVAIAFWFLVSAESKHRFGRLVVVALIVSSFLVVDLGISTLVGGLLDSGSYTNRADAIASVPKLFTRDFSEIVWGSGYGSEPSLFSQGFFQQNGFNIVDNQLVTTLATAGIVGLVGLCILFLYTFGIAETQARTLLVFMIAMLFSFDYLRWHFMLVLLFALFGLASASSDSLVRRQIIPANGRQHGFINKRGPLISGSSLDRGRLVDPERGTFP
jgi:hypothetical protein